MILGTTLYNMCAVHWRLCSASGGIQSIGGTSSVQMEVHHQCIGKYHDLLEGHPGGGGKGFSVHGGYHQFIGGLSSVHWGEGVFKNNNDVHPVHWWYCSSALNTSLCTQDLPPIHRTPPNALIIYSQWTAHTLAHRLYRVGKMVDSGVYERRYGDTLLNYYKDIVFDLLDYLETKN